MRQFVRQRRIVAFRAAEAFKDGHLHMIGPAAVMGRVAAMMDVGFGLCEERFGVFDPLGRIDNWLGLDRPPFPLYRPARPVSAPWGGMGHDGLLSGPKCAFAALPDA